MEEKVSARERVGQLVQQGLTGQQIGEILLQEDYSMRDAFDAFLSAQFGVYTDQRSDGVWVLYITLHPVDAFGAIVGVFAPKSQPSVVWQKQEQ